MKKFILEYLKIIGYTVVGLVFAYSSFYLLINLYHAKELNRVASINVEEDSAYEQISNKMTMVTNNLASFEASKYKGDVPVHYLLNIQGRLQICSRQFENETYQNLKTKKEFNIQDIEKFRQSFQNDILNTCLVEQIYDLAVTDETNRYPIDSLKAIAPYVELNIKNLLASTEYMKTDILNNHIYYFTTEHTNTALFGKIRSGYAEVMASYNRAADLLLELSEWFKEEAGR